MQMQRPRLVNPTDGLVASGIGKSFKGKRVVRNVSLRLQRGEAVGLLGPNGAGKTTTFHIMSGLLPADEGNVQLDGNDITTMPVFRRARLGLGYLPQESSIFRGLTVEQNIRAVLESTEGSKGDHDAILDDLMAEFSIAHLRNTVSVNLSGGERRRLEIARALALRPVQRPAQALTGLAAVHDVWIAAAGALAETKRRRLLLAAPDALCGWLGSGHRM